MSLTKKLLAQLTHSRLSKLDELYQRHAGEECYLFGDGVSLKWMDLNAFGDRLSIIGNMIVYHREADALNAPYCVLTEPFYFWPVFPYGGVSKVHQYTVHGNRTEYVKSIREHPEILFFLNISNFPFARFENARFISRWYKPPFESRNPFRDRSDSHNGTLNFQLSLAIFMGFRKAYLVGHDYTHSPSLSGHFYEKGKGIAGEHTNYLETFIPYANCDIELVTVTLDSSSEKMPAVTYEQHTGRKPRFKENLELLPREKLDSLARWPHYSIY